MPLTLLIAWLVPARAAAPIADVVEDALRVSPTARMGQEDLIAARHRTAQSMARLLPAVSASDRYMLRYSAPQGDSADFVILGDLLVPTDQNQSASVGLSATLPLSAGSITGLMQARGAQDMTTLQVGSAEDQLVGDLVLLYGEVQYVAAARPRYAAQLEIAREALAAARDQRDLGEATELELSQARLDEAEAEAALESLERALPILLEDLALTAGGAPEGGLRVCPMGEGIDRGESMDLSAAPAAASGELTVEQDALSRTDAWLDSLPGLTLMGGASWSGMGDAFVAAHQDIAFDSWYVSGSLSMTLFDGFGAHHARREAAAGLRKSRLDLETTRDSLDLDDRALALDLAELAGDLELTARAIELQALEVESARSAYIDGGAGALDSWLSARDRLEQLHLQRLSLQRQQLTLTTQRWLNAGRADALVDAVDDAERGAEAAGRCKAM